MARAAQRDRAPEHLVKALPWRVWTGTAWEKHQGSIPHPDPSSLPTTLDIEAADQSTSRPSGSHDRPLLIPWCETQGECAICLSEFAKGDCVRELPCHHIFHLDEVDAWLINRKKLVRFLSSHSFLVHHVLHSVPRLQGGCHPALAALPRPKDLQFRLESRHKPPTNAHHASTTHRTHPPA